MLIICNGAFKSGSSWLHAVLVEMLRIKRIPFSRVPDCYTNDIHSPTKIVESELDNFIFYESFEKKNYITKSHFFKKSTLSSPYPDNVIFLFVERDMKDAIVSHYYHIKNKFRVNISFVFYYSILGKYKAYEIYLFNMRCKKYFGDKNFISYHDLKNKFPYVVRKLCNILDIKVFDRSELEKLIKETTIEKLREKSKIGQSEYYPSKRKENWRQFRKGVEGDWINHFSGRQLSHINNIEKGIIAFSLKSIYFLLFTLRRHLGHIE